jgi:hypothetical protein
MCLFYRLTEDGVTALDAEAERVGRNARTAGRQLAEYGFDEGRT